MTCVLETRVAKRTKDLERISRALREREVLSVLGTAVAEITHEIANHVLAIPSPPISLSGNLITDESLRHNT